MGNSKIAMTPEKCKACALLGEGVVGGVTAAGWTEAQLRDYLHVVGTTKSAEQVFLEYRRGEITPSECAGMLTSIDRHRGL